MLSVHASPQSYANKGRTESLRAQLVHGTKKQIPLLFADNADLLLQLLQV